MSKFALDTNIISYLLKKNALIVSRIVAETSMGNSIAIPPIAYYEIRRGLIAVKASSQMRVFERLCAENIVGDIGREMLDIAASIHASLRSRGRLIEDADILIAAFCIAGGYTLVTNNTKHFESIEGLKLENWAA